MVGLPVSDVKRIVEDYGFKFEGTDRKNCSDDPMTAFLHVVPHGSDCSDTLHIQGPTTRSGRTPILTSNTHTEIQLRETIETVLSLWEKTCDVCGEAAKLRCGECKGVRYCSKECQKKDWKNHKQRCAFTVVFKMK